jgi:hypothetical protein
MGYNIGDRFEHGTVSGLMGQVVEVNDRIMTVEWEMMIVSQTLENWNELVYSGKVKYHPAVV